MEPSDSQPDDQKHPAVRCDDCQSALSSPGRQKTAFLLLDQLAVPLLGCDDHLEQFSTICGWTTERSADLLDHLPAGGIRCPGCRLAPYEAARSLIPVQEGAVAVTACPEHRSEIAERFETGLRTRRRLTSDVDTSTGSSL